MYVTVCANWIPVLKYLANAVNKSFQWPHNYLLHAEFCTRKILDLVMVAKHSDMKWRKT